MRSPSEDHCPRGQGGPGCPHAERSRCGKQLGTGWVGTGGRARSSLAAHTSVQRVALTQMVPPKAWATHPPELQHVAQPGARLPHTIPT